MNTPNINELATRIHENNKAAGWWDIPRPRVQTAWLVITELAEATEAERAGKYADLEAFESDLAKDRSLVKECRRQPPGLRDTLWSLSFRKHIKDTFEDEIADAVIRLLDFAASDGTGVYLSTPTEEELSRTNEEAFFEVASDLTNYVKEQHSDGYLMCALAQCYAIAENKGFNLWQHVDLKLKYNATRPKMHGGKKF